MTIPKNLQEKRDAMCEAYKQECLDNWHSPGLYLKPDFKKGFESACNLLLPEIEKIHTALKEWIDFEHSEIEKEGPYVGKEINPSNPYESFWEVRPMMSNLIIFIAGSVLIFGFLVALAETIQHNIYCPASTDVDTMIEEEMKRVKTRAGFVIRKDFAYLPTNTKDAGWIWNKAYYYIGYTEAGYSMHSGNTYTVLEKVVDKNNFTESNIKYCLDRFFVKPKC